MVNMKISPIKFKALQEELVIILGLDGSEVEIDRFYLILTDFFGAERTKQIFDKIVEDVAYFRDSDPASRHYTDHQILSIRRGMSAIAAHRVFEELITDCPDCIYGLELIAKYVQKDTNIEIHPCAKVKHPFAIDHGHGTVVGATCSIGHHVFIYHGVTLGASGLVNKAGRRHPKVGNFVFFGNGSQVLGPSILENEIRIASGALIRDSWLHSGVTVSMRVRIAGVEIPENTKVFAEDPENRQRYWVQLNEESKPQWVTFPRFNAKDKLD
jgi:serine acetyltransferase